MANLPASVPAKSRSSALVGQLIVVALVLAGAAMAPPDEGDMLLVPINPAVPVAALALAHGAQLKGVGPLPGSLIMRGRRADLAAPLLAAGVVPLAAHAAVCGPIAA